MLALTRYKYRLAFTNTLNSLIYNLNNILSSSNPHIFVFLIFTCVNICQNLLIESLPSKVSLLSKISKQCFAFGHFWLFSQNNQLTLDWKFKNDWIKRLQKIPKKLNVWLSLVKRNWLKKFVQSIRWDHACLHIPHKLQKKLLLFFSFLFDFVIINLVRSNLIFWKYWRRPTNIPLLC